MVHGREENVCVVNSGSSYFFMVVSANAEQAMLWKMIEWI